MKNFYSTIFRLKNFKRLLLLLTVALVLNPFNSYATHIVGGELNYTCLGGNKYQIKLRVYRDCYTGVPPFDNPAAVGIFDNNNVLVTTVYLNFPGSTVLPATVAQADVCVKTPTNICVEVAEYVGTVTLPPRAGGYQLAYQRCCRNPTVDNIVNPGNQGATYYARIPDQAVACNSNPVFKNWPPLFVCANNQILFDHSATDADGDVIVYSLCSPLDGGTSGNSQPQPPSAPPYNSITWKAPYSATNPLGGNTLTIDPNTGLMTGVPTTLGQYVVGVCADEYRNGNLISTTKRDFQFNVINCQPDIVAASIHAISNCTNHTVNFTNNSTGTNTFFWNFGDLTTLSDTSHLKNPTYVYPAVGTYTVTLIAYSGVNSKCNDTLKSYVVNVTACPPCTMTLATSKLDATCGSGSGNGCTHIVYTVPCAGTVSVSGYGNSGGASVSGCGVGSSATAGAPSGTTPTSIILTVNGSVLPAPTAPPQTITYTGQTLATCPKTAKATIVAGPNVVFDYYLWSGTASSPGSATVTPSGGTGPYTYSWTPGGANTSTASGLISGTYTVTVTDNTGCQKTGSVIINSTSGMTVTTGTTLPTTCSASNGTATVTASGGVGPYTYLWMPGGQTTATATGLSVGVYTVNVLDNGCSVTTTVTINAPVTITVGTSKTNAKCNGNNGTATATPSGGTGTYTYLWNNGKTTASINNLTAGTYTVTVTDGNGCMTTASYNITDVSLSLTSSSTNMNCGGAGSGTATITATGGTGAYTYSWNTTPVQTTAGATGLQGGTYIGTVTDGAGCIDTVMATIVEPPQLLPEPKNTSTISCAGVPTGSAHVDVSGGTAGFTYLWNNGQTTQNITGLTAGTYTITVTDSKGCTGVNSISVTMPSPLSLTYTPSDITTCFGDNTGAVTVNPSGGNPGYTYSWNTSPVQTTQSITGLTAGTYIVTVTDLTGCTASLNNVVVSQPAIVSLSTGATTVGCAAVNGTATVTATGGTGAYTYLWSPSGKTTATASGLSAGTYSVTVTDANGCSKTSSVSVTNATAPTSSITSQSNVGCTGSATGSATITGSGGTPGYTYSWSPGGNTNAAVTGLTSGSYVVTITDTKGCTATQAVAITQPASALSSSITGQSNVNCTGSATGSAIVSGSGGTAGYTYLWNPGGNTTTTVTGLTAGTYSVTVTDANGCTKLQSVAITQPASAVTAIASATNTTCGNSNGTATVTASGGTGSLTYMWTPSGQTTLTASNLSAGSYDVIVTDANGCTKNASVSVNSANGPTVGISGTVTNVLCSGSATGGATVTATGGTGTLTYSWNNGVTSTTGTATNLTAGTYIVTVTDANGCAQGQTIIITQPASALVSTISSQSNVNCFGSATGSATITSTGGTPGYVYNWSNGQTITSLTGLTAGTYSVVVTDNNGCSSTQSVIITQPATALTSTVSAQSNVNCFGNATGSATVTGIGGTPAYFYSWSNGQTIANLTGLTAGTYSVIITDNKGCSSTQNVIITQPVSGLTATPGSTNAACGSSNGTVSVTASGGTPTYIYNWSTGATTAGITGLTAGTYSVIVTDNKGCSQTAIATVAGSPGPSASISSSTDVTCNGLNNGTATVTVSSGTQPYNYAWNPNVGNSNSLSGLSANTYTITVTDAAGCSSTTQVTIIQPAPFTLTVSSSTTVCAGEPVTLTATPNGGTGPFTYSWLPSGPVVNPVSPVTYTVIATDANGCLSPGDTVRITPLPTPVAGFDTLSSGKFHQVFTFPDLSTGGNSWYWDFGDGTTSTLQNPFHTFTAGTYTVTQMVTNTVTGCTDTITKIVMILPNIIIPNVFTPNHDGVNDDFWIPNTGFESFELNIYDRWGLKLFSTNAGDIRWDGRTSAGQIVPDGTYYYLLNAKLKDDKGGKDYSAKGFINLTRGGGK